MRRALFLLGTALCMAGCTDVPRSGATSLTVARAPVGEPTLLRSTRLRLIKDSSAVFVGDTEDQVNRIYVAPADAYDFRDLPPGFQQPYRAAGFQNKSSGFGAIYYDSRVAEATLHEDGLTFEQVTSTVSAYEQAFGKADVSIPGTRVLYWFWEDVPHNQRFMICAVQDRKDLKKFDLTTSVGEDIVMNALRMAVPTAREDRLSMERTPPAS